MEYGIDIFSGAGGLSLGAEMAGVKISTGIEINPHAAKTFQRNHKGAKVLQGDIQNIDAKALYGEKKPVFVKWEAPHARVFQCRIPEPEI